MTTLIFEFNLDHLGTKMATRPNGQAFLEQVLGALEDHTEVVIDFCQRPPTPSFADQCLGGLVSRLGLHDFKKRVHMKNVSDADKPLIRHVILSRSRQHSSPGHVVTH